MSVMSFEKVGTGLNVYESPEPVEGVVKWLETPEDVIAFATSGDDVSDVIVVARGGTTTFLTMALNAGIRGVVRYCAKMRLRSRASTAVPFLQMWNNKRRRSPSTSSANSTASALKF